MRPMNMKNATSMTQLFLALVVAVTVSLAPARLRCGSGNKRHRHGRNIQSDGAARLPEPTGREAIYSWGYGCVTATGRRSSPAAPLPSRQPATPCRFRGRRWSSPKGQTVTIYLTNNLPTAAGNTSILFPGFTLTPLVRTRLQTRKACWRVRRLPGQQSATSSPPRRRARTLITAERKATSRSRWGCTAPSLCCRPPRPPVVQRHA